jgi:GNAT superfamily N-acetyltransferase
MNLRMQNHVVTTMSQSKIDPRRELRPEDPEAIVRLHEELYAAEHGMGPGFVEGVRGTLTEALARGWPEGGGAWLVDGAHGLAGCLGLTNDGDGLGTIRWVLLRPELRGLGLGRRMISEAVAEARRLGFERLELRTFGALRTAAAIYRSEGFMLMSSEETDMWGPPIVYQHYVAELS